MDPQHLTLIQSISALISLGRIPFAIEVPTWTLLGCLLSSQIFPVETPLDGAGFLRGLDWWATLQCMLVTWGTNVAINYGNEYFDWELDRPGQVAAIQRDIEAREAGKANGANGTSGRSAAGEEKSGMAGGTAPSDVVSNGKRKDADFVSGANVAAKASTPAPTSDKKENEKVYGNTTRIIHDGTFPPWVALACCAVWQGGLIALILLSRWADPAKSAPLTGFTPNSAVSTPSWSLPRPGAHSTPFKGLGIHIGFICTFLSHSYVGPPLRLHYNGFGELVSALFLSPVAVVFGMVGHYTAVSGKAVAWADLIPRSSSLEAIGSGRPSGLTLDCTLWTLIAAFYCFEQARIIVMHVHDIEADIRGGKRTFVSRVGHRAAKNLYLAFNLAAFALFTSFGVSIAPSTSSSTSGTPLVASGRWIGTPMAPSLFLRFGGRPLHGLPAKVYGTIWLTALVVLASYSIPIVIITHRALVAEIPENQRLAEEAKKAGKRLSSSKQNGILLPQVSLSDCAMLVSLQTLGTAAWLCVAVVLAAAVATLAG